MNENPRPFVLNQEVQDCFVNPFNLRIPILTINGVLPATINAISVFMLAYPMQKVTSLPYYDALKGLWISFVFKSALGYNIKQH